MTLWKFMIVGMGKSGFIQTSFSPRNPPPYVMYSFVKTIVPIAARLRKINIQACPDPAILLIHQSQIPSQ
jgi:hypothetical protein